MTLQLDYRQKLMDKHTLVYTRQHTSVLVERIAYTKTETFSYVWEQTMNHLDSAVQNTLNTCTQTFSDVWWANKLRHHLSDIFWCPRWTVTVDIVALNWTSWYSRRQTFSDVCINSTTLRIYRTDVFRCYQKNVPETLPWAFYLNIFYIR